MLAGMLALYVSDISLHLTRAAWRTLGILLALLSGVSYAGVFLLNDLPETDPISSVFWGDLLSAVTGLPFLLQETVFTPTAITSLVILGAFQVGLAYVALCIGLKTTPPVTASLISGIEPVLNPILVAVFYGERVGPLALVNILDIPFIHCFGNAVRNLYFRFYKYGRRRAFARDEQLPIQNRLSCGVLLDVLENGVLFLLLHLLSHA